METLIDLLSQDKFHLGFLGRKGEFLYTETAYLDYIVAPDGGKNIAQAVVEHFSEEERHRLGLIVTSYNFSEVFHKNPPKNVQELEKLARKLKSLGLEREITVWNQLVSLCPVLPLARRAIEMLESIGLTPDVVTYNMLIDKAKDYDTARAIIDKMEAAGITPDVVTYSTLIDKAKDYDTANAIIDEMKAAGITPNVVTYSTLVDKANDYDTAHAIIDEMKATGITPNVVTYNTLIDKAKDYDFAHAIIDEMKATGITPNVVTYNTLIDKAKDYDFAHAIIDEMKATGITPNVVTYSTIFTKNLLLVNANELLDWYLNQPYHPESPMEAAIKSYSRVQLIDRALVIVLNYPHLTIARKFMRENSESALTYFRSVVDLDPSSGNGNYALGLALTEVNRGSEATLYLEKALTQANIRDQNGPRVKHIKQLLHCISNGASI